MTDLRISVQSDKCQGYGKCAHWAPETFSLDATKTVVLHDPPASPDEMLLRAAKSCPYRVITVTSDEKGQIFPPVRKSV
jgi:ferredoxin